MATQTMLIEISGVTSTYLNTFATAVQVVPTVQPYPGSHNYPDDGRAGAVLSHGFPLLAAIILGVAGGLVAIYFAYEGYRRIWGMRNKSSSRLLPPLFGEKQYHRTQTSHQSLWSPEPPTFSHQRSFSSFDSPVEKELLEADPSSPHTPNSAGPFLAAENRQYSTDYLKQNASRSSVASFAVLGATSSRNSVAGSASANPRRSNYGVKSPNTSAQPYTRPQRLSGAPHSPFSRIEIVPPQPLGRAPGAVVAEDKSTLNFSAKSGISGFDDLNMDLEPREMLIEREETLPASASTNRQQFEAAKAAYLAGGAPGSLQGAAGLHSMSSLNGPFADSNQFERSVSDLGLTDSESGEGAPFGSARYSLRSRSDSPQPGRSLSPPGTRLSISTTPMEMPTSPLERLQHALRAESRRSRGEDSS